MKSSEFQEKRISIRTLDQESNIQEKESKHAFDHMNKRKKTR